MTVPEAVAPAGVPRIARNDWSTVPLPASAAWRPALAVSVVIPAYACQAHLDLALAALSTQTYPSDLLDVVVVDDGSPESLRLPELRPENCRIIRAEDGWGPGSAVAAGVRASAGAIVHRLDADMVVFPDHVETLARRLHAIPYAVALGAKRFADVRPGDPRWPAPQRAAADAATLFTEAETAPHDYIEEILRRTDDLRTSDQTAFMAHVGATAAVRRDLYDAAGGYATDLHLGEDTELGYRLAQAGAVFVPETGARAWHLGHTAMMERRDRLRRHNRAYLADRMPQPRWLRANGGSAWSVPLVTAVVEVGDESLEVVRACVDGLLHGVERDLRVVLVGPWASLTDGRRDVLADPALDLRLLHATYHGDSRVTFAQKPPVSAFPGPFLLCVPPTARLSAETVPMLLAEMDRHQAGLVRAEFAGGPVELWRTAAIFRARHVDPDADPRPLVQDLHGERVVPGDGIADLRGVAPADLARLPADAALGNGPGAWSPLTIEVGGLRSLLQAAIMVARTGVGRLGRRIVRRGDTTHERTRHGG